MAKFNIIFPADEKMKGYFSFYHDLDNKYESRYKIKSSVSGNKSNIYNYKETTESSYFIIYSELIIHFKHSFALTNYSFSTAKGYSHPTGWKVYGYVNNKARRLIDTKSGEKICGGYSYCHESIIQTFKTDTYNSFNKYVFEFLNNTFNTTSRYGLLRSIELFGIVYNQFVQTCKIRRNILAHNIFLLVFTTSQ